MGVNANISESLTGTIEAPFPEFEAPPANPMEVQAGSTATCNRDDTAAPAFHGGYASRGPGAGP